MAALSNKSESKNLLLWGYCAGDGLDEVIARSVLLAHTLERLPTEAEVRQACFPYGPVTLDVLISGGWLRVANADFPPVLNAGQTDLYSLSYLMQDLSEHSLRKILYDRIFRRYVTSPTDNIVYELEDLEELREFYDQHQDRILGLGQLIGPGLWYPEEPLA